MAEIKDPENTIILETTKGKVVIQLLPEVAPGHVARIKELAREKAYDGVVFHRVINDFMAQTGDVKFGDMKDGYDANMVGTGGSELPDLPAEFSKNEHFVRGVVGMARAQDPNSANSQFFIMFGTVPSLDGEYTIVGKVVSGMDKVDAIKKGDEAQNGAVGNPDRIVKAKIAADK